MTQDFVLIPRPRHIHPGAGVHTLQPGRLIWLDDPAWLRVGQIVRDALAAVAPDACWALTAARVAAPGLLGASLCVDPAQTPKSEGYRLTISPDHIHIVAHDAAGAFYAAMTLKQLARQFTGTGALPCLRISDWPDFPNRGVMLDISRDKVPTLATLFALMDKLAEWKVNQFQLYTEHTFAYRSHRVVWEHASPMTGEDIMALDAYCRARFIELVPNQNSFGHMARWLEHDAYKHLAEAPDGYTYPWGGRSDGPFSLAPLVSGSIELLQDLYAELLPHFASRQFNVGLDETWDLGQGRSKEVCEEIGKGRVYLRFLQSIHALVRAHGRTMQFWGDIIQQHPELIAELPRNIIALEWGYEANHPFAEDGARFAAADVPFYVCPGTSSWNSIAGRTDNALGNLWNAAENGLKHGAIGYLNTDWGDNGHFQPLPVSYLGYAYGAAVSWAAEANRDIDLPPALDLHAFYDRSGVMGRLAYDLGNAYQKPGARAPNNSPLFMMLHYPEREDVGAGITVEALKETEAYIDEVMGCIPEARMAAPDAALVADEFRVAAALLKHAGKNGVARLEAGAPTSRLPAGVRAALADELEPLIAEYRRLWLARNHLGGLVDSAARLERVLKLYRGE
ncbi:MAG: family 20 glycosylhydrolase [Anaerolineae bacterium]|nr:family 20 glycosylhydrolase [Anaerolineae bacterium]